MLKTRIASALIGLPLVFFALLMGGLYLRFFLIIISLIGLYEFYTVFDNIDIKPIKYVGYLSILFFYITEYSIKTADSIIIILMAIFAMPVLNKKYNIRDVSITIIGVLYMIFFSYIGKLRELDNGYLLVWFIFIISWLTDTSAYFWGKFLGKNKLCPSISPNKTLEGSIGGLIGAIIGSIVFTFLFYEKLKLNIFLVIVLSLIGSIVAQIGDLFASSVKRNCHIKDYGKIIPGHGGILDRFDSILYVAPYLYLFFTYVHR
ncbi:phosphatidate cytidylyltransferase [Thermoanaerobacterium sp. RBIITD]|uniref:phosphatidate cytidylyltransferase n=1 Tax=Thermoanaerobacterium sp. RBIITD TaxID=1550240 RepID=UPI000BB97FC6|nr:phosphatidate cytidylyltransferase [Thermoanaerobacterium sp. RBIITD]SNX55484.1 phosphatidate cytidylyltransferase [Thermoanaerobacterium sp. RBIITD]